MTGNDDSTLDPSSAAIDDPDETVDWLRAAFRDVASPGESTPEAVEAAAALVGGELPPADAESAAAALLDAPARALEVRVAAAMREARATEGLSSGEGVEAEPDDTVVALPQRPAPDRRWVWAGFGAVAAAFVAMWFLRPPVLEAVPDDGVRAGGDLPLASALEDTILPREAFVLEWSGGPNAATYDIYITTPELVKVYQSLDQPGSRHQVPLSALTDISSGQRLLWRVVAAGPRGRRAHSNAFEVVVE